MRERVFSQAQQDIKLGIYKGPQDEFLWRDTVAYDKELSFTGETFTVDGLMTQAIENAVAQGRRKVVFFDFGCGRAQTLRELANNTRRFGSIDLIRAHPEISVELIGLTDTPGLDSVKEEELVTGSQLKRSRTSPPNVNARVDYYAVTRARPLEDYFERKGIEQIDLGVGIHSLSYIPVPNFQPTVESFINRLSSGGTFIACGLTNQVPGFLLGSQLNVRLRSDEPSVKTTLRDQEKRFLSNHLDLPTEGQFLQKALERYMQLGVLTKKEINKKIKQVLLYRTRISNWRSGRPPQIDQLFRYNETSAREGLKDLTMLLQVAEKRLAEEHRIKNTEAKIKILRELERKYTEELDTFSYKKEMLVIKKR